MIIFKKQLQLLKEHKEIKTNSEDFIEILPANSEIECYRKCKTTTNCNFYTFLNDEKACSLFSACNITEKYVDDTKIVTGSLQCIVILS